MNESTRLTVQVSSEGDQIVCRAVGEIDPHSGPQLEGELRTALFAGSATTLVLNLAEVTFMDSSGLRVVIDLHRAMREREGRLVLRHPSATVSRLLEITNLGANLDIEA